VAGTGIDVYRALVGFGIGSGTDVGALRSGTATLELCAIGLGRVEGHGSTNRCGVHQSVSR